MKKLALVAALVIATSTATAGVTAFGTYDYDNAAGGGALKTMTEAHFGAALDTKLGTVDAAIVTGRLNSGVYDDALGFELGYSNGLKVGAVSVTGRAAFGRLNQVETSGVGGFTGNTKYYSLAAEAGLPLTQSFTGFVGYRHRNGLEADTPATQNRYTAGVDVALTPKLGVRAGVAHTRQAGQIFNGLTTAVSYKF